MDKGLTHFMRGRARIALLLMVCMVAIVALPAFAHAAVFSAEYPAPGALLHGQPAVVSVDVAGAVLNTKTGVITVNGIAYKAYVTQAAAGSWSAHEVLQPNGTYKTTWVWNAGPGVASMSVYPSALATGGPYAVTATVKDTAGNVLTDPTSWGFSIAAPVVIPPVITPVAANLNAGCNSCHFAGSTLVPASVAADYVHDNAMGANCVSCHHDGFPKHGVTVVTAHAAVQALIKTNSAGCVACHGNTITSVATKNADGSFTVPAVGGTTEHNGCSCHVYKEATGKTSCEGCHVSPLDPAAAHPYHVGAHDAAQAGTLAKCETSGCHTGTLQSIHPTCGTCHTTSGAAKSCATVGCHNDVIDASGNVGHVGVHAADTTLAKCETSGCHTGALDSLHTTAKCATCHTAAGLKSCATVGCHDAQIDASGNVISHGYTAAGHTATSYSLAGQRYMGTDAAAQAGNLSYLNPTYAWTFACSDCHSMLLDTQHANPDSAGSCATCHNAGNTGAGDVLKGGNWNKSCNAAGCHPADPNGGVPVAHLVNGQMDYAHSVAASLTALPAGCSASAGSGSYSGTDYARTACHYSDIIQEHNRKIESGPNGTIVQTISVTCAQCHASAAFKALNGKWDGTCDACHTGSTAMPNHSVVGSAEYNRVHGLHQAPSYYSQGTNSSQGVLIAGMNSMDAHGALRTAAVAAHPSAYKPIGCAQAFCHQNAYMKPGSGFYGATVCTQCHSANVAAANSPSGLMSINNGAVFSASTAVTVNSSIVANGGATLVSMAVDPGTGVYGTAVPYVASYGITIPSTVGMKTIRVKYLDSAARTSTYTTWIWKVVGPSTTTASVSGGNGTISPSGAISVAPGADQTFTFTPSAGYHVDTLTVDGTPVAAPGSSYAFTNVTAAHTIVVTFAPTTFASSGFGAASYSPPAGYASPTNDYVGYETRLTLAMGQALPANSKLTFNTKYDIENGYDFGYVQVSTDGGTTWTNIAGTGTTNTTASDLVNYGNLGNGITGTQATWAPATFDLSAYAGQTVKIRFDYVCDAGFYGNGGTSGGIGWNVDDVAVGPTGAPVFTDDFSTMKPDWSTYTNTPGNVWGY